ncbi:MAG: type II toxin-antitoxin system Phd/YefM family antitoxin [Candidatus Omnitrophica bacterium]|nr:type II toxin-antitoxin system Phd/YefM family antitoxin [Candidatus Omnitrophota bacterium]
MTVETIPAVEARVHFGDIMKRSYKDGSRFIVEKSGIPMVVILNARDYSRMMDARDERFKILDKIKGKLPRHPEEEITDDVAAAIRAVRSRRA